MLGGAASHGMQLLVVGGKHELLIHWPVAPRPVGSCRRSRSWRDRERAPGASLPDSGARRTEGGGFVWLVGGWFWEGGKMGGWVRQWWSGKRLVFVFVLESGWVARGGVLVK